MKKYLQQETANLMSEDIKLKIIGDVTPFPEDLQILFKNDLNDCCKLWGPSIYR